MSTQSLSLDPAPEYQSISVAGFSLSASVGALDEICALVRGGLAALPRRGLEIGGLLFGNDADPRLEAVHEIAIGHRFGPSYSLSDSDIELFRLEIAQALEKSGPKIVGHFRSHTKGELEVTAADLKIAELIGRTESLMLLIKASHTEPAIAHLFLWHGGETVELAAFPLVSSGIGVKPQKAKLEQPASQMPAAQGAVERSESPAAIPAEGPHRNWPGAGEWAEPATLPPAVESAPARAPIGPPASNAVRETIANPVPPSRARLDRFSLVAASTAFVCAAVLSYLVWHKPPAPSLPVTKGLDLEASRSGDELVVSWDRSSPTVLSGSSGVLAVQDGTYQTKVQLTAEQLRSETLYYAPKTGNVRFRLEIYGDRDSFSGESLAVSIPLGSPQEHATQDRSTNSHSATVAPPPAIKTKPAPITLAQTNPQYAKTVGKAAAAAAIAPATRSFAFRPPASPPELIPEPPERTALSVSTVPTPALAVLPVAAAPPPPFNPVAQVASGPIRYVAPVAIRKISPVVSASLRAMLQNTVSLQMRVRISAEGVVNFAAPLNASGPVQRALVPSAVEAAMLWRFEPARSNGKPTDSETVLTFDFERRAR